MKRWYRIAGAGGQHQTSQVIDDIDIEYNLMVIVSIIHPVPSKNQENLSLPFEKQKRLCFL